jgi:hypothetical protein
LDLAEGLGTGTGRRWPGVVISAYDERDLVDLIEVTSAIRFVSKSDLSARAIIEILMIYLSWPPSVIELVSLANLENLVELEGLN